MSTYFISDIHGEYNLFLKLLNEINFDSNDTLYILGDIIDKGKDSIKLVKFISQQKNMVAIMGNHEYSFCQYIKGITDNINDIINNQTILNQINQYFPLSDDRMTFNEISYIVNLPYYIEDNDFLAVHAGLEISNNTILPIKQQNSNYMLFDRKFKNSNFQPYSKTIIYGHTPCFYDQLDGKFIKTLKENSQNNVLSSYSKIRIDTGVSYTKMLGVLRKEDMQEFYTSE